LLGFAGGLTGGEGHSFDGGSAIRWLAARCQLASVAGWIRLCPWKECVFYCA
jgi:hypothetical protein